MGEGGEEGSRIRKREESRKGGTRGGGGGERGRNHGAEWRESTETRRPPTLTH